MGCNNWICPVVIRGKHDCVPVRTARAAMIREYERWLSHLLISSGERKPTTVRR